MQPQPRQAFCCALTLICVRHAASAVPMQLGVHVAVWQPSESAWRFAERCVTLQDDLIGFRVGVPLDGDIVIALWFGDIVRDTDTPAFSYAFHTAFAGSGARRFLRLCECSQADQGAHSCRFPLTRMAQERPFFTTSPTAESVCSPGCDFEFKQQHLLSLT